MKDKHIFRILSLLYLALGIRTILHPQSYWDLIRDFSQSPASACIGGMVALVIGFLLVSFHNKWLRSWTVIITIIGWLALIKGILLLVFPAFFFSAVSALPGSESQALLIGVVLAGLGGIFFVLGVFVVRD